MILNQRANSRLDNVVAASAIGEDAQFIVQLRWTVHADRDANAVFGKELDDGGRQQGGIGGQAEIDAASRSSSLFARVGDYLLQ
jgi:hypothetical protein